MVPTHGRQYYRLADSDLSPTDGLSASWPFRPAELDPWYAEVERYVGLAGGRDNLPWLPDSELRLLLEPTPAEAALRQVISARWPGARAVLGRSGKPIDSLERAAETNRLSIRTGAIARKIEVDASGRARGVVWIDHQSGKEERAQAPLVFLCASALESTRLLLLSRSTRSPEGLGASSGALGRYLMDHIFVQVLGKGPPLSPAQAHAERRSLYLPRFDARELPSPEAGRGFGVQVSQAPADEEWSSFSAASFGEMLPRAENRVTLDPKLRDAWGIPALRIDCRHGSEDMLLARKQVSALRELAAAFGVELTQADAEPRPPGTAIHECGTARMGNDPDSSVLDPHNECWEARGLYVTDAACFPTQGTQNPMLTILAITARACDHAVRTARTN
ncbi:MAG TPA: GMC family oxidoreductase [Terracidiphilus sp.]